MSIETQCPGCGAAVAKGQPFCPRCGKDLASLWQPAGASAGLTPPSGTASGLTPPGASSVQAGSSQRPWPFAREILADRLAVGGYLQKPIADQLLAEAVASSTSLVDVIVRSKQLAPEALRDAMSRIFGLPVANLASVRIDPQLIASFPSELARKHMLLPLHREGDRLVMVVADPTQADAIRLVRRTIGLTIDLRLAALDDLAPAVHQYFSPRLVALLPSGETLDVIIPHGEIKIGRADHNDLVLPDPTVGSSHAILRELADGYHIVDFGSRNGVFVDGNKINGSQLLKNGDVIQVGQCLLTFKLPLPEAAQLHDGATQILTPDKVAQMAPIIQQSGAMRTPFQPVAAIDAAGAVSVEPDDGSKKKKKKKKGKEKDNEKLKSAWIGFIGRILAQIVGAAATIILGLAVAGKLPMSCNTQGGERILLKPPTDARFVESFRFDERINGDVHNASGVVSLGDGRFLFADNNVSDALFEFTLNADGIKTGPIVRHALNGLSAAQVDDIEALTLASKDGRQFILMTTSLYKHESKKNGEFGDRPSGLVRASLNADGSISADIIPNFRDWFLKNVSEVGSAAILEPDEGGLNVEGLAWDAANSRLLFGLRTPTASGQPLVVPVKVADLAGPWTPENLAAQPAIRLHLENAGDEQGIRAIEYDSSREAYLVVVGNATSNSNAPFLLYTWKGGDDGATSRFRHVWFDKGVKPEGTVHASVGGKGAIVFADDAGGYEVLWDSDPRLAG